MPLDGHNVKKEGTTITVNYPEFQRTAKRIPDRMGWRQGITELFYLIVDLGADTKRADLDLGVHLSLQESRIDNIITKRDKDLKVTNENFRIHRELIDGFTEIFDNQQREIDGLWKVINRLKKNA